MRPPGVHLIPPRDPRALVAKVVSVIDRPRNPRISNPGSQENLAAVLELYKELV